MAEPIYRVVGNMNGGKDMRLAGTVLARVYYRPRGSKADSPPLEFRVRVKDTAAYEKLLSAVAASKPYYKDEFQVLNLRNLVVLYTTYEYENTNGQA